MNLIPRLILLALLFIASFVYLGVRLVSYVTALEGAHLVVTEVK